MTLTEQILQLSQAEYWLFLGGAGGGALIAFYLAFRWFTRGRIIEDTPTAKIRSAHQGYLELTGHALMMDGTPVLAPLTGSECCWYRFKIEKEGDKNWRTVESDTSDTIFQIKDETGICHIDPEGAEVTPTDKSVWYGHSRYPSRAVKPTPNANQSGMAKLANVLKTDLGLGGRYRYTEERIYSADPLYAIGQFETVDHEAQRLNRSQEVRDLMRQWKQNRAWLLQKFDLNHDGEIDPNEWDLARQAAKKQIDREHRELDHAPQIHLLKASQSSSHPFLISTLPQFSLVRRYRLKAGAATVAFFVSGSLAVWLMNARLL